MGLVVNRAAAGSAGLPSLLLLRTASAAHVQALLSFGKVDGRQNASAVYGKELIEASILYCVSNIIVKG
jgi:hypothetical protein